MTKITAPWLTSADAQRVCAMLTDAGHQAWFVGGCVRNALLGAPVADLDLSTDARPDRVMALASAAGLRAVPTGIDHGTVTIVAGETAFEVTTFRRDVKTDGRRAVVAFSDRITDDARRRDFTMNALYADADGMIADPLGGLPDLRARKLRFIEDPQMRIREDYLRILRYFRFHAWYGDADAGLDPEALAACAAHIDGLKSLSKERITAEMIKLLAAPDPAPAVAGMAATGALAQILPGATALVLPVLVHIEAQQAMAPDPIRRLAVLGGDPQGIWRLSNAQKKALAAMKSDHPPGALGYYFGQDQAMETLAVRAASLGQGIAPDAADLVGIGAGAVFPLKAADLMPALRGRALGAALRKAEARWVASGFTLTQDDLLG